MDDRKNVNSVYRFLPQPDPDPDLHHPHQQKTLKTKIKRYFLKHSLDSFLNQMFKIFRVLNTFLPGSGSGYVSKLGLVRGSVTKVSDPGSGSVSSIKL